jgi:hypothetical protein
MADYLALDWDDQRLVGVAAHVASKSVTVRAVLDFQWAEGELPSEQPAAAGKRLKAELENASISPAPVIVSLPREEAVVRLLELPECTDDELPELVRFQAVTRSALPLEKLLLDYLPLPALKDAPGRRVWMATIGKPLVERVETLLSAAGLEATAIRLSSLGAAELIAHQSGATAAASDPAILIVSCVDMRVEITAIWQQRIVLMHAATLSSHDPPEAQLSQILAETARSTVALSQAAPGLQVGSGWLIGPRAAESPLAEALAERVGFKFHVLTDPATTPGVTADGSAAIARSPLAWAPVGLLLSQAGQRVESVDFLHPRRQHPKPDRRKLYMVLGAAAAVLLLAGLWIAIQNRVWHLDDEIASIEASNKKAQDLLKKNATLIETAGSVDDWTQRDIDWLEQFRVIEGAKGGADKLYLTTFDANLATRDKLAVIVAAGRARVASEVDDFEDKLHAMGYGILPKEISEDASDPLYPVKLDLSLDIVAKSAGAAGPKGGVGIVRPGASSSGSASGSGGSGAAATMSTASPPAAPAKTEMPHPAPAAAPNPQAATGQAANEPVQNQAPAQPAVQPSDSQSTPNPMPMPGGDSEGQAEMGNGPGGPPPSEVPTAK